MAATLAGEKDISIATKPRSLYSDKRSNGTIVVIAGSSDYHGAAALASNSAYNTLAALRVGIGYAILYVPKSILDPVRRLSPSLIVKPFGRNNISEGNFNEIKTATVRAGSLVIGMGIGRKSATLKMASRIISHAVASNQKIVVDADAIYAIKNIKKLNKNVIITPQDHEFSQLYGSLPDKRSLQKRTAAALSVARRLNCCVLLKGHDTVITDGKSVKIVRSKSSALATMGIGDVLSGIIGGYAATGTSIFKAGIAGAYLHSRIGDLLYKEKGNHIISSDLLDKIPETLRKFDKSRK